MLKPIDDELLQADHPWVEKYRLPVIHGTHPRYHYYVTVAVPLENPKDYEPEIITPTEEEAKVLAAYNAFTRDRQGLRQYYVTEMAERVVDYDPSRFPTKSFEKRKSGNWAYRGINFRTGTWPYWNDEQQFPNLLDLIDWIEKTFPTRWDAYKEEHGIVSATS